MSLSPWIFRDACSGPLKMRLFCLPYAGGGASLYRHWQQELPSGIEVCRLQLPGREERLGEAAINSVYSLVDKIMQEIRPLLDKPFAIFGHSMGGIISHRLAYCLQLAGKKPEQVFIAAVRPPHVDHLKPIHQLSDTEFKQSLLSRERTSKEVLESKELMQLLMPMLRADFKLAETYRTVASAQLDCELYALAGGGDDTAPEAIIRQWNDLAAGYFELNVFSGGHFFVQNNEQLVLAFLKEKLQQKLNSLHHRKTSTNLAPTTGEIKLVF